MRYLIICISFLLITVNGFSQNNNCFAIGVDCPIGPIAAMPFLNLPMTPESAGIGGSGIAITPSATSITLNSSNLAFIDSKFGMQAAYVPWLNNLGLKGVYMAHTAGYYKLGDKSVVGVGTRLFDLGNIEFTDINGGSLGSIRPVEFEGLVSYNRKLSQNFAMGLSLKYLFSRLANGQTSTGNFIKPAKTIAGDLSFTYRKPINFNTQKATLVYGLAIRNIGPKVSYIENSSNFDYLPTNLGFGIGYIHEFAKQHTLTFTTDLNRLLVPTPSSIDEEGELGILDFKEKSPLQGMVSSFGDAPNGLSEDFHENQYAIGIEYRYKYFIGRIGHFNEHKTKGNRKYITTGLGIRIKGFGFDFSKDFSAGSIRRPAETFRFALSYNFEPMKEGTSF